MKIEYVNTYETCEVCGAAMRTRQELPAFITKYPAKCVSDAFCWILCGSVYEEILKFNIEVKAVSDECLAKSVAVT